MELAAMSSFSYGAVAFAAHHEHALRPEREAVHVVALQVGPEDAHVAQGPVDDAVERIEHPLPGDRGERDRHRERPLFELLPPGKTGVAFANTITAGDSLNVQPDGST